ncbi:MAG: preprotein translocase subunit SecG, partial [Pseudomonadota bacterium]
MEKVVLIIHLILTLLLIGAVLLQQSEGGALGMGGGGNVMSGRSAATALQKATWGLAAAFVATSLLLALFAIDAARDRGVDLNAPPPPPVESGASP